MQRWVSLCLYLSVVAQFNVTNVTWRGSLCQENDGMLSAQCVSEGLCTDLSAVESTSFSRRRSLCFMKILKGQIFDIQQLVIPHIIL